MTESADDLVRPPHREELERMRGEGVPEPEPSTIHYSELPETKPDSPLYREWSFYRQIIGQLLADGHEGRWLLIKHEALVGIWDTQAQANTVRLEQFLKQSVLMKQILVREPLLRIGYNRLCRS
jgi:hypothetical protein